MSFKIEGQNVFLRILRKSDTSSLIRITNDNDTLKFMSLHCPFALKHARALVSNAQKGLKNNSSYDFGIFLKNNKLLVGVIRLMNINKINKNCEVGFWIGKEYQNNGYSKEALKLVLNFGFKRLILFRISAKIMHLNTTSVNLVEKFGFKQEGRMRNAILKNGKWIDGLIYGLLRDEYKREVTA